MPFFRENRAGANTWFPVHLKEHDISKDGANTVIKKCGSALFLHAGTNSLEIDTVSAASEPQSASHALSSRK